LTHLVEVQILFYQLIKINRITTWTAKAELIFGQFIFYKNLTYLVCILNYNVISLHFIIRHIGSLRVEVRSY
jgi:hypothetical protein